MTDTQIADRAEVLQMLTEKAREGSTSAMRLTPHDGRHTFASLMIAAGVNAKALSTFMGHAKIGDHARPLRAPDAGLEAEAAGLLDAYLTPSASAPRRPLAVLAAC